jgi:hypothetical protein
VTSSASRRTVRLIGPASPELIEVTTGGLGYVWRWDVTLGRAGTFEYRFVVEGDVVCASGVVEVS